MNASTTLTLSIPRSLDLLVPAILRLPAPTVTGTPPGAPPPGASGFGAFLPFLSK